MNKDILQIHMVYPRTKSIENNIYEETVFYKCNEDIPDFREIKEIFSENKIVLNIFDIIENNPAVFIPCSFDSFRIEINGINKYAIINKSMPQSGRTTLIQNINIPFTSFIKK